MAAVVHVSPADVYARMQPLRIGSYLPSTSRRPPVTVYRRRQTVAVLVAVGLLSVLALAVGPLLFSAGGAPVAVQERPASPSAVYVVQPGDTFWEIARRIEPVGDPRPLVARHQDRAAVGRHQAGERLALPTAA